MWPAIIANTLKNDVKQQNVVKEFFFIQKEAALLLEAEQKSEMFRHLKSEAWKKC